MTLVHPPRSAGWLGSPATARVVDRREETNPFLRWRELLWSYDRARSAGWDDERFVSLVRSLDDSVATVAGTGFRTTPLTVEAGLAAAIGVDPDLLLVKDETGNVAGSHKARHLFGLLIHLAVDDTPRDRLLAISSCGNAALAAATVARAAGRPLRVFIPTWATPAVVDRLEELGAQIEVCPRREGESGDPCYLRFREAVAAGAYPFGCQGTENVLTIDGGRTLAWELVDQVPHPGRLFVQVGGGALGSSIAQGHVDAVDLGETERLPRIHPVQAEGCAPLDRAVRSAGRLEAAIADPDRHMTPWTDPHSAATGILDDVTYDWLPLAWAVWSSGGSTVVAPEATIVEAHQLARQHTTIPVDPTGTAGLAGLLHWSRTEGAHAAAPATPVGGEPLVVLFTGVER